MTELHIHLHGAPAPRSTPGLAEHPHHAHPTPGPAGRRAEPHRPDPRTEQHPGGAGAARSDQPTDADRALARRLAEATQAELSEAEPDWTVLGELVRQIRRLERLRTADPDIKAARRLLEAAEKTSSVLYTAPRAAKARRVALLNQALRAAGVGSLDRLSVKAMLEHPLLRVEALLLAAEKGFPILNRGELFRFLGRPGDFDAHLPELLAPFDVEEAAKAWGRLGAGDTQGAPTLTAQQALDFAADPLAAMTRHAWSLTGRYAPTPLGPTRAALTAARLTPAEVTELLPRLAQLPPGRLNMRGHLRPWADRDPGNSRLYRAGAILYYQSAHRGNWDIAGMLAERLPRLWSEMVGAVLDDDSDDLLETLCAHRRASEDRLRAETGWQSLP